MTYIFKPMTKLHAERISTWKYEKPYNFYDFEPSEEITSELLNGDYFCVLNNAGALMGFSCSGNSARVPGGYAAGIYEREEVLDIGLGLEPSETGKGLGRIFVEEVIDYFRQQLNKENFRMVVASFNQRAITVYRANGFVERRNFLSKVNGIDTEFVCLTKENQ